MAAKRFSVYGQVIFDEFVLKNMVEGNGWWANKFAIQAGIKYIDVAGIDNLDLQLEGNVVRPYTYSHDNLFTNYSHYLQPIAHPLGANFSEAAAIIRYQPVPKLNLTLKSYWIQTGRDNIVSDPTTINWGGDINKGNSTRVMEYNNNTGQGTDNRILMGDLLVSYMFKHNLFIDVKQTFRNSQSPDPAFNNNTSVTSVALRLNIAARSYDF